jgi:hypothetical protein
VHTAADESVYGAAISVRYRSLTYQQRSSALNSRAISVASIATQLIVLHLDLRSKTKDQGRFENEMASLTEHCA